MGFVQKLFGTHSEHELKRITPIVDKIEALHDEYDALSDEQLKAKTQEFKARLAKGETLDDILPEAFATVRAAGKRVLGMEHYRVQLIGGIILHQGRIAEMRTGEGKTLVSTLPAYLNSLTGEGVMIVTVNDYLAKRDAEWMGQLHEFLGVSVGIVLHDSTQDERRAAYACDITYVTNNELGFDYLRDNMAIYKEQLVLRGLKYAVIDEVDSVLIDEARTPLIISGQGDKSTDLYEKADKFARTLKCEKFAEVDAKEDNEEYYKSEGIDYIVDERTGNVIKGSKDKYCYIDYLMTYMRKKGVKTDISTGTKANVCPHCGAPLDSISSAGQCNYCGCIVTSGEFNWVLAEMDALRPGLSINEQGVIISETDNYENMQNNNPNKPPENM